MPTILGILKRKEKEAKREEKKEQRCSHGKLPIGKGMLTYVHKPGRFGPESEGQENTALQAHVLLRGQSHAHLVAWHRGAECKRVWGVWGWMSETDEHVQRRRAVWQRTALGCRKPIQKSGRYQHRGDRLPGKVPLRVTSGWGGRKGPWLYTHQLWWIISLWLGANQGDKGERSRVWCLRRKKYKHKNIKGELIFYTPPI